MINATQTKKTRLYNADNEINFNEEDFISVHAQYFDSPQRIVVCFTKGISENGFNSLLIMDSANRNIPVKV